MSTRMLDCCRAPKLLHRYAAVATSVHETSSSYTRRYTFRDANYCITDRKRVMATQRSFE
jgi:hypothetical protein